MAWAVAVGAAISGGVAVYKGIKASNQESAAKRLASHNPGFQVNQGVIQNAKTLSDQYGNYQLPGYSQMGNNINNSFQNSFDSGKQGATSGGDVLDLATRMAYGKNQAFNQLGMENAQGKQSMLGSYLTANDAAGQQYQDANAYDREQYGQQLRQQAALTQAGNENMYGAVDQFAGLASKFAMAKMNNGSDADSSSPNTNTSSNRQIQRAWNNNFSQPGADDGIYSTS